MTTPTVVRTTRRSPLLTAADVRVAAPGALGPFSGRVPPPPAGTPFAGVHPVRSLEVDVPTGRLVGAGVDLTDVERIGTALRRTGPALVRRVCGPDEQAALAGLGLRLLPWALALAFGLTEATIKAAGGIPPRGSFTDVDASALLAGLASPSEAVLPGASPVVAGTIAVGGAIGQRLRTLGGDVSVTAGARRVGPHLLLCWVLVAGRTT